MVSWSVGPCTGQFISIINGWSPLFSGLAAVGLLQLSPGLKCLAARQKTGLDAQLQPQREPCVPAPEVFDLPYRDKPVPTSELRLYRRQIARYRTHRITTFRTSHPTESSTAQPSKCPVVPRSLTKSSSSLSELARQAPVLLSVPLLVPRVSSLWISARSVLPLPISPTWQVERRKSVSQSNICARHAADV